jgi:hypothetical protein
VSGHAQLRRQQVLQRFDPMGISQGLSADYVGQLAEPRKVSGAVAWRSPRGQ